MVGLVGVDKPVVKNATALAIESTGHAVPAAPQSQAVKVTSKMPVGGVGRALILAVSVFMAMVSSAAPPSTLTNVSVSELRQASVATPFQAGN